MQLMLEARTHRSSVMRLVSPLIAAGFTIVAAIILFGALGHDPLKALFFFFIQPVASVYGLAELLVKATPLALCALGLMIGFRANVWNIGAEGQLTLGAIAGSGVALLAGPESGLWVLPAMLIAAALSGMVWGFIPAFLRTHFNANEILTSLMLSYVAIQLLGYLTHGPWRDPDGFNFPETRLFDEPAILPILIEGTRLNAGSLLVIAALIIIWLFVSRSFAGFKVSVNGQAPAAARYAGFSATKIIISSFLIAGALAGLAGIIEVSGSIGQLRPVISPGYGFAAIIVAFVGRLHPIGVVLASLLMSLMYLGGESLQINMQLPLAVTGVFQGLLLFFLLGCDVLVRYRIKWRRHISPVSASDRAM